MAEPQAAQVAAPVVAAAQKGLKAKRPRTINRSRLASAIHLMAKDEISGRGKAPISTAGLGLLEDICTYVIRNATLDAERIMEGRSTIKIEIIRSALRMNVRYPGVFEKVDATGVKWAADFKAHKDGRAQQMLLYNQQTQAGQQPVKPAKIRTSGKNTVMQGRISVSRVMKMMRKQGGGKNRISVGAAAYMAGAINEIVVWFMQATDNGAFTEQKPKRLGLNDYYNEARENLKLGSIIPHTLIIRFGGDKHKMPRRGGKRERAEKEEEVDDESEPCASPPKKKARKTKPKKVAHKKRTRTSPKASGRRHCKGKGRKGK